MATENVYEKVVTAVNKQLFEQLEVIQKQRAANGVSDEDVTEEVHLREEGIALNAVLRNLDTSHGRLGQVMLATLWKMREENIFQLVFEAENATEYVEDTRDQYRDYYYIKSLAQVVDTVLAYVNRRKLAENPVLDPETQTEITVEMLIGTDGLISKLKEQASFIESLESEGDKDSLIGAIGTGQSRTKVDAKRETIEKKNTTPEFIIEATETIDPETKRTIVSMNLDPKRYEYLRRTVLIATVGTSGNKSNSSYNVVFPDMSDSELAKLRKALGKSLVLHQKSASKPGDEDEKPESGDEEQGTS